MNWNETQMGKEGLAYATALALKRYGDSGNYKGDGVGSILVSALNPLEDLKKNRFSLSTINSWCESQKTSLAVFLI